MLCGPCCGLTSGFDKLVVHDVNRPGYSGEQKAKQMSRKLEGRNQCQNEAKSRSNLPNSQCAELGCPKKIVPILFAADRSGATLRIALGSTRAKALRPAAVKVSVPATDGTSCFPPRAWLPGRPRIALNQSAGLRPGHCHIQTYGNRQSHFKQFLFDFRGVATKYLGNHLLLHLLACLGAAVNSPCMRFAK